MQTLDVTPGELIRKMTPQELYDKKVSYLKETHENQIANFNGLSNIKPLTDEARKEQEEFIEFELKYYIYCIHLLPLYKIYYDWFCTDFLNIISDNDFSNIMDTVNTSSLYFDDKAVLTFSGPFNMFFPKERADYLNDLYNKYTSNPEQAEAQLTDSQKQTFLNFIDVCFKPAILDFIADINSGKYRKKSVIYTDLNAATANKGNNRNKSFEFVQELNKPANDLSNLILKYAKQNNFTLLTGEAHLDGKIKDDVVLTGELQIDKRPPSASLAELALHLPNPVNALFLDHSSYYNKIFGTYIAYKERIDTNQADDVLLPDGKERVISTDNEYFIKKIDGKSIKMPMLTVASLEITGEAFAGAGLNDFDQYVYTLIESTMEAGNNFFTLQDLWNIRKGKRTRFSDATANLLKNSIEKMSSTRLSLSTQDREGNQIEIRRNILETRYLKKAYKSVNNKPIEGYLMISFPIFHELTKKSGEYYYIHPALLDYSGKGKLERVISISMQLVKRIEMQKHTLKKQLNKSHKIAINKAKSAEKEKALSENKKPDYKHLDTEQYYKKPYYSYYRVVIKFEELCERVEDKPIDHISKDVKSKIKKDLEERLKYYTDIGYIESYVMPASSHNKTKNIIINLNPDDKPLQLPDRAEERETAKATKRKA